MATFLYIWFSLPILMLPIMVGMYRRWSKDLKALDLAHDKYHRARHDAEKWEGCYWELDRTFDQMNAEYHKVKRSLTAYKGWNTKLKAMLNAEA